MSPASCTFLRCVRILTVEQFREPVAVFWSLLAPVAFLALSAYHSDGFVMSPQQWIDRLGMGLAYVAITMSLFTFGMYLIGRRESGFVRSFLTDPRRRRRFVLMQYLASFLTLLCYGAVYGALASMLVDGASWQVFVGMFLRFAVFGALVMFGAIGVAILPLTFQAASSVMSMILMVIVVSGLASSSLLADSVIGYLNIYRAGAEFVAHGWASPALVAVLSIQAALLVGLGCAGMRWQRINPEWSNR